jgi:surfactin synthase thioesterase subunit
MISGKEFRGTMHQNIHLFCLPFAGGNTYSYREFKKSHADFINIVAIDLPGHGRRMGKPLLTNIDAMAEYVLHHIQDDLSEPYAIYGHSMGAIIAYVLSQKLRKKKLGMPIHLFVSGRQGPPVVSKEKDWHLLPKKEFIQKVMTYGGIPEEVAEEEDLMDLFVPILRADFQAVSDYKYEEAAPLDLPITVMIGLDEDITYEEALQWQNATTRKIAIKQFPGGHFFIFDHLPEIGNMISRTLAKAILDMTNEMISVPQPITHEYLS